MEIKDIAVTVERLEEVRGGTRVFPHSGATSDVSQIGVQLGLKSASSTSTAFGLGNQSSSLVGQYAPQSIEQGASVATVDYDRDVLSIADSLLFGAAVR